MSGSPPSADPAPEGGSITVATWPLMNALTLGALPTAVASARMHTRAMMAEWALNHIAEDISHVVSELVTNALRASTGTDGRPNYTDASGTLPVIHLRLQSDHRRVIVEVWDLSTALPVAKQPDPDAESGRGLLLVEALTKRWGWKHIPNWPGKVVWAELVSKPQPIQEPS